MDSILCDDLLREIFRLLPPSCFSSVSLVSKRWLRLFRSSLSFLSLRLRPHLPPPPHSFLSQHHQLTTLFLHSSTVQTTTTLSDAVLQSVTSSCVNLTHLRLFTGPVSLFSILSLSTSCRHLSTLSLILSRPFFSFHFLSSFPCLKNLGLKLTGTVSGDSLTPDCYAYPSSELRLETLRLQGISTGDYVLGWLWSSCDGKTLKMLSFEKCEDVGDNPSFALFMKKLVDIQEVELMACRSIIDLILSRLIDNDSLKSLLIHDGGSKEGLLRFIRHTRCNLEKLDFRLPLDLDNNHLIEIGANFRGLSVLTLRGFYLDSGEGLKSLALALRDNLEELALPDCGLINKVKGLLVELAQNLRNLKKLDLSGNYPFLLDKEFIAMMGSCSGLLELKLTGNHGLTNASLFSLCTNCKHLRSIDILNCWGFGEDGIEFLVLNSNELRYLKVEEHRLPAAARERIKYKFIEVQDI